MTTIEFSDAFDSLLNSFSLQSLSGEYPIQDIALDEYEKSLFLTKAQEEIVVELYAGRTPRGSFEETEELRKNLKNLIRTATINSLTEVEHKLYESSQVFSLPDDVLFITYESAKFDDPSLECLNGKVVEVVPVRLDQLHRTVGNPFRRAGKKRVLRIDGGKDIAELISDYNIKEYIVRYISKPTPIILMDSDMSINGYNGIKECELDSVLHNTILDRAVQLAIASRSFGRSK